MNTTFAITLALCASAFILCDVPAQGQARGSAVYTLTPVANGVQLKTPDGRVVLDYLTQKPGDVPLAGPNAACFHPINTPSGVRISSVELRIPTHSDTAAVTDRPRALGITRVATPP